MLILCLFSRKILVVLTGQVRSASSHHESSGKHIVFASTSAFLLFCGGGVGEGVIEGWRDADMHCTVGYYCRYCRGLY
jgi:hypothetical protein